MPDGDKRASISGRRTAARRARISRIAGVIFGSAVGALATALIAVGGAYFLPAVPGFLESTPLRIFWTLPSLMRRVREAETELQEREQKLRSILGEIEQLSFGEPGVKPERQERRSFGVGGTASPHSRLLRGPGEFDSTFPESKLSELLGKTDVSLLETLPLGSPVMAEISSGFGFRASPFGGELQMHEGVDLQIESAAGVLATADGVVREAGYRGSYGRSIVIEHGDGIETLYAHLSHAQVKAGQRVCRGQQIGLVGSTGNSTGPHLHYEVRFQGQPVDPVKFIDLAEALKALL